MYLLKKLTRLHLGLTLIKKTQSFDSIETHVYRTSKDLVCKKEETKYNSRRKKYKSN